MRLITNNPKYWEFIRRLRNDKRVKTGFIQQEYITKDEHNNFMEQYGKDYYICLIDDMPAGYVGQINGDIRVATHPDFQGKGIGKFMINQMMKDFPNSFAKVKVENEVSTRLFESCGFKKKYYILEKENV
jgi:RimJ/RimL family protein N-acetyltransferase